MTDINNPMRFTARPRDINVRKWLGENRQVTKIEFEPGQIYVHWEEREATIGDAKRVEESILGSQEISKGGRRDE